MAASAIDGSSPHARFRSHPSPADASADPQGRGGAGPGLGRRPGGWPQLGRPLGAQQRLCPGRRGGARGGAGHPPGDAADRRPLGSADDHQWHQSRAADSPPGGAGGGAQGHQPARGAHLHPLARPDPAARHGRRPGGELRRHRPRRDLHLPLPGTPERHLLVPQPLRPAGAAGPCRSADHRCREARAVPLRPRARAAAHRLDLRGSYVGLSQPQDRRGLLQRPGAHRR